MKKSTKVLAIVLSIVLLFPANVFALEGTWETVGLGISTGQAWRTSTCVDDGIVYLAYQDSSNNKKLTVMKHEAGIWSTIGSGLSIGDADYIVMEVYNHTPYVLFHDRGNGLKLTLLKYDGTNWNTVGTNDISSGTSNYTSMYIYKGTPYIAFADYSTHSGKAHVRYLDSDNTWKTLGTGVISTRQARGTSIAVYDDVVYVAYQDYSWYGDTVVKKYENGSWSYLGGTSATQLSFFPSLDVDSMGRLYLAYQNQTNNRRVALQTYEPDTDTWVMLDEGFGNGTCDYVNLEIHNDVPYVAYKDLGRASRLYVQMYNGTDMEFLDSEGASTGYVYQVSMSIEDFDVYVAYCDRDEGYGASVMKFAADNNAPERVNAVPASGGDSVHINTEYTLDLSTIFEDIDGDALTYEVSVEGEWYESADASYKYTPDALGDTEFVFRAHDGAYYSIEKYTFTLTATNNIPNRVSTVSATAEETKEINTSYTLDLSTVFEDIDNDALTYEVDIDGAGYVSCDEGYSYLCDTAGEYELIFKSHDGYAYSTDTYTVILTVNTQPERQDTVSDTGSDSIHINTEYTLDLSTIFEDKEGTALTYEVDLDGAGYVLCDENYAYTPNVLGDTVHVFRAHDGTEYSGDTYTFTLTATNTMPNRVSTVLATAEENRETDTPYTVDLSTVFEDADSDALTYEVSIDGAGYVLCDENYSYPCDTAGEYEIVFKSHDGTEYSDDTYTVNLTVNRIPNRIASVPADGAENCDVNAEYTLDLSTIFEDYDGHGLTYEVSIDGGEFSAVLKNFAFTPVETGVTEFVFRALDIYSTSVDTYTLTITAVNGQHTITYDANGGVGTENETHIATTVFDLSDGAGFANVGYILKGWRIDSTDYMLMDLYEMPNNDMTAYAIWEEDSDGDTAPDDQESDAGTDTEDPNDTPQTGTITVTVYDESGVAVENISCILNNIPYAEDTNVDGFVSFNDVFLTQHSLTLRSGTSDMGTYTLNFAGTAQNAASILDDADGDNDGRVSAEYTNAFMTLNIVIRLNGSGYWIIDDADVISAEDPFVNPRTGDDSRPWQIVFAVIGMVGMLIAFMWKREKGIRNK